MDPSTEVASTMDPPRGSPALAAGTGISYRSASQRAVTSRAQAGSRWAGPPAWRTDALRTRLPLRDSRDPRDGSWTDRGCGLDSPSAHRGRASGGVFEIEEAEGDAGASG